MDITFLGATTLVLDDGADQLLFDAFVTRPTVNTVRFGKLATDNDIVREVCGQHHLDRVRAVFVSASRYECAMDVSAFARELGAEVYGSASVLNIARGGHVPEERLHELHPADADTMAVQIGSFYIRALVCDGVAWSWRGSGSTGTIEEPLIQPARASEYKPAGQLAFLVEHEGTRMLVSSGFGSYPERLSEGSERVDCVLAGVGGLGRASDESRARFAAHLLDDLRPDTLIPLCWDNYTKPLSEPVMEWPRLLGNFEKDIAFVTELCRERGVDIRLMMPGECATL